MRRYELGGNGVRPYTALVDDRPVRHAKITTDGSCLHPCMVGGWAAVVEVGSDGWVVRGHLADTTSTRMEMLAVIEGLTSVPDRTVVLIQTDVLIPQEWQQRWLAGQKPTLRSREDRDLWERYKAQLARLGDLEFRFIRKRDNITEHQRCHKFARAEARALAGELGLVPAVGETKDVRKEERLRRRAVARALQSKPIPASNREFLLEMYREDELRRGRQVAESRTRRLPDPSTVQRHG